LVTRRFGDSTMSIEHSITKSPNVSITVKR
jgi:hypothetical protein